MAKKTDSETSKKTYEPKITDLCLYKIFLDQVYLPKYADNNDPPRMYGESAPNGIDPESIEYRRFGYDTYLGSRIDEVKEIHKGPKVSDRFYRGLTNQEIVDYLKDNKSTLFQSITKGEEYKPPATKDSIRKVLERLVEWGIILEQDAPVHVFNKMWFMPYESHRSFTEFIGMLDGKVRPDTFERYSFLFKTRYFGLCLNRQLVLRTLKEAGLPICLTYLNILPEEKLTQTNTDGKVVRIPNEEIDRTELTVTLPLLGRFPKLYESQGPNETFIDFIKAVEEYYVSHDELRYSDLEQEFFGEVEHEIDNKPPVVISEDVRKRVRKTVDKICSDLKQDSKVKKELSGYKEFTEYVTKIDEIDKDKLPVKEALFADPDATYRKEDPWVTIVLTDDEKDIVRKSDAIARIFTKKEIQPKNDNQITSPEMGLIEPPIDDDYRDWIVDNYHDMLDLEILPILSVIQFSPSALFYFICKKDEWLEECTIHGKVDALDPVKLLNNMTKMAISDHLNGMSVIDGPYPIHTYSAGNVDEMNIPSVLTFTLGENQKMSLGWSEYLNWRRSEKPRFLPYLHNGLPRYSQRVLDIVKMTSPWGIPFFRDFLISALTEHDSEWRKYLNDRRR